MISNRAVNKMNRKFLLGSFFLVVFLCVFIGTYRTYIVLGASDAPNFSSGDKVIINRSAFDITFPFSSFKLMEWNQPKRGDMILCSVTGNEAGDYWLKRVVGIPGDTIEMRTNKLFINGKALKYEVVRTEDLQSLVKKSAGTIVALESGAGLNQIIAYSHKNSYLSNFGPEVVLPGHFFVLGDNRDNSMDSRLYGMVNRNNVYGKYVFTISRTSP